MPWLADDVISVDLKQEYIGQGISNILFYKIVDIVGTAITDVLLALLAEALVDFILPMQNQDLDHIEQIINNLTDGTSQSLATYAANGAIQPDAPVASFMACGSKKAVGSRITRPGSIRIAGLVEPNIDGNELSSAYNTLVSNVNVDLAATVIINDQAGTVATFNPVVVGRNTDGTFDVTRINDILSFGLPRLTTQNSRKPER